MYDRWFYFQATLDSAVLSLARTKIEITAQYADLTDDSFREEIFPHIETEYETAASHVLDITERDDLVDRS